jgi:uncharacterized protein YbcV (DUF1398 family)
MVTLAELDLVHEQLGKADTLDAYCRALADLGVTGYDSYVVDGRTVFRTTDGSQLTTPAHHDIIDIATEPDHAAVRTTLARAAAGEVGYVEMSQLLGAAGLDRWSVDTLGLVMTYTDVLGEVVLVEQL